MNLFQLTAQQKAMAQALDAAGFDDQTIADTLECEGDDLKEKRLGYIAVIKQKRAMADARKQAAKSIEALAWQEDDAADRMEKALFQSMLATGDNDLIGLEFEAHIKGKAPETLIKDLSKVPAQYMREAAPRPPSYLPDKAAIKAALLNGEHVDGCELGLNKRIVLK